MRRAKRKRSNRLRRKHLDKLAQAKLTRMVAAWDRALSETLDSDLYLPSPELEKIRKEVQALINTEKKRIRQEYLTTRKGKAVQDA